MQTEQQNTAQSLSPRTVTFYGSVSMVLVLSHFSTLSFGKNDGERKTHIDVRDRKRLRAERGHRLATRGHARAPLALAGQRRRLGA